MTILTFLLVLFVLVLVHELGHFIVAKLAKMRVDEFGIGFPPKLFGVRKGETEYTFNLLPIGGFVKIFGEDAVGVEGTPESDRAFTAKNKWAQAAVLVAGVSMNVLFAWLLFSIALGLGVQTAVDELNAGPDANLMITGIVPGSPAESAGLPHGAVLTGISAEGVTLAEHELTPSSFSAFVEEFSDEQLVVSYRYGGEELTTTLGTTEGLFPDEPSRPAVGIALSLVEIASRPFFTAITEGFTLTLTSLKNITVGISSLLYDAIRFKADFSQVAGPVGIVGLVGEASAFGITSLLMFTAFISLNLAIINLLPFPALDGGRLLFVAIEAVKGSPIKPKYVQILNTTGFALLILLMIAVTYNDILRLIG